MKKEKNHQSGSLNLKPDDRLLYQIGNTIKIGVITGIWNMGPTFGDRYDVIWFSTKDDRVMYATYNAYSTSNYRRQYLEYIKS